MKLRYIFRKPEFTKEAWTLNRPVKAISLLFFVYMIGWGIVDPILPVYVKRVTGNYFSAGLFVSALQFFSLFFSFVIAPIIDRVKKKSLMSVALGLYTGVSPILLALTTITQFVVFRIYHAAIATTLWVTGDAYVREHSPRHKEAQAIGLFDFGVGLAQVIGGLLAALLIPFLGFNIIYAVSCFSLLAFFQSQTLPDKKKPALLRCIGCLKITKITQEYADIRKNVRLARAVCWAFPFYFSVSLIPMALSLFIDYVGGSLPMIGMVAALFYAPVLFESYFSATKEKRGVSTMGMVYAAMLFLLLFFAKDISTIFVLALLIGIAFSAVHPIFSGRFTELMPRKEIGELSAFIYAMKAFAAAAAPLIAGFIADIWGIKYVFLLGFVLMGVMIPFNKKVFAG